MSTHAVTPAATDTVTSRRRGADETRARLLGAGRELFTERGYDRTTVRDIGQRADVDPALIARYFGSKAALYVESVRPPTGTKPVDLTDARAVAASLDRLGHAAPTPMLHAAVRPHEDAELQAAAMAQLESRLLSPMTERARAAGWPDPRLRAEIAIAVLAGVLLSRVAGALSTLAAAPSADVGSLVAHLARELVDAPPPAD